MATFSWGDLKQAADDAGFTVLPAGIYEATVKKAEAKKTGTGKDKISVQFVVSSGPMSGKSVFNDFVISPENGTALGFFFRHMKALGFGPEYFAANPDLAKLAADMVGRGCQVDVGTRVWNEEDRNEVKGIKPLGTPGGAAPATSGMPQPQPAPQPQPTAQPQPQPTPAPAPAPAPSAPKPVEDAAMTGATDEASTADAPPAMPF